MNTITAVILGILIGWLIEWLIDWIYWRRKQRRLAGNLSAAEANAANLQAENSILKSQLASLEASTGQFEGAKGEFEAKIASLENEINGLGVVNRQLTAEQKLLLTKIADLEGEVSEMSLATRVGAATLVGAGLNAVADRDTGTPVESDIVAPVGAVAGVVPPGEDMFTGNVDITDLAEIAKFKNLLEYVEGIGPVYAEKLREIGLLTCLDFLKAGATRKGREEIVEKSGISSKLILKWVNHIDLYRIKGIGSEYADLLEAAGIDTVVELAQRNPTNLFEKVIEVNAAKELVRKPPTAAQVEEWIAQAKTLARVISY